MCTDEAAAARDPDRQESAVPDYGRWGYGYLDLTIFDQSTCWCDVAGTVHRIVEMTPDYRVNILAFLHQNADYFHLMTIRRHAIEVCAGLGQGSCDLRSVAAMGDVLRVDAVEWLEGTAAVGALRRLESRRHRAAAPGAHGTG